MSHNPQVSHPSTGLMTKDKYSSVTPAGGSARLPLRIAVVTESFLPAINGVTNSVLRVIENMSQRGHHVEVVAPGPSVAEYNGATVHSIPSVALPAYSELRIGYSKKCTIEALQAIRPDIVHIAQHIRAAHAVIGGSSFNGHDAADACDRIHARVDVESGAAKIDDHSICGLFVGDAVEAAAAINRVIACAAVEGLIACAAKERSFEKLRSSGGTLRPPLLAISRCSAGSIDANPRFEPPVAPALFC